MAKDKRTRVGTVWTYEPVWMDRSSKHLSGIPAGTLLRVIQPHGCPRNGTMGCTYVELADSGDFVGLVMINSLVPTQQRATAAGR